MILADKIINERKKNGWSQEELAELLSVSRQSVSKWESAQAVPDLQKIIKLAEIFGVSTDYLLKDEIEPEIVPDATAYYVRESTENVPPLKKVTMQEANEYISVCTNDAPIMAAAISMFVSCPVVLIFLSGLSASGLFGITNNMAAAIGLIVLFFLVGAGVYTVIKCGNRLKKYEWMKQEDFDTEYGIAGMVKSRKEAFEKKHSNYVVIGVVLCVMSALPLVVSSLVGAPEYVSVSMVCVLLLMVATAINLFIRYGHVNECFNVLLQEEGFTSKEKKVGRKTGNVSGIYWGIVTTVYLAISFITGMWDRSWIVWPVAGVLFAAVMGIVRMILRVDED